MIETEFMDFIDLMDPVLLILDFCDFWDYFDKACTKALDLPFLLDESGDFDETASYLLLELAAGCSKSLFDPEFIN